MKKIFIFVLFGVVIALVYYLTRGVHDLLLKHMTWQSLFYLLFLSVFSVFLFTVTLSVLLGGFGYWRSLRDVYLVLTTSLAANYYVPVKASIPIRIFLYKKVLKVPYSTGMAALAVEVFTTIVISAVISVFGVKVLFTDHSISVPLIFLVLGLTSMLLLVLFNPERLMGFASKLPFKRISARLLSFGVNFQHGLRNLESKTVVSVFLLFVLGFVFSALRLYIILSIFGVSVNLLHLLFVQAISQLMGHVSFLPGGLGVRDASITLLLMKLGVSKEVALSAALIERTLTTGLFIALGVASASILGGGKVPKRFLKSKNESEIE